MCRIIRFFSTSHSSIRPSSLAAAPPPHSGVSLSFRVWSHFLRSSAKRTGFPTRPVQLEISWRCPLIRILPHSLPIRTDHPPICLWESFFLERENGKGRQLNEIAIYEPYGKFMLNPCITCDFRKLYASLFENHMPLGRISVLISLIMHQISYFSLSLDNTWFIKLPWLFKQTLRSESTRFTFHNAGQSQREDRTETD